MTATATLARRPFVLEHGDPLLLTRDALVSISRLVDFLETTGLKPEDVVSDPVVALPVPIYPRGARFSTVNPEALWNPLFWLPEDIALRFRIRETDAAEPRAESDAEWALRIALELSDSGLYDPEQGWLDVFALYGLDVTNPIDLARVEAWQAGEADETLDAIDLRQHVSFAEDNTAFRDAQEMFGLLMSAQWAYTSASLLVTIENDAEDVRAYAKLGAEMLVGEPSSASDDLFEASVSLEAGEPVAVWGPKIVAALNSVIDRYADATFEIEQV